MEQKMTLTDWLTHQRTLCDGATKGPWRLHKKHNLYDGPYVDTLRGEYICETAIDCRKGVDDGKFIASARTSLPLALDVIEKLSDALKCDGLHHKDHCVEALAEVEAMLSGEKP